MNKFLIVIFTAALFLGSCNKNNQEEEQPVARVQNKYLYLSDLDGMFNNNMNEEDSAVIARKIIEDWVKKQLLLQKAEENLDEESKDIERQIDDYRTSLLLFKYQQQLIQQKLDTVVSDEEIANYYNQYSSNFILNQNLVKAIFIKIPLTTPDVERLRQWYKSDDSEDKARMEDFCYQYAVNYDNFNNNWVDFSLLLKEIPTKIEDQERFLKYQKYIETKDEEFYYFLRIKEYRLKSDVQPMEYAKPKIKNIILNKRKFSFFDEMENNLYNDALNHNDFEIY